MSSIPTELNFSPNYENVGKYSQEYQFASVLFPENAPLLAQNLNEAQQILLGAIKQFNSNIVSDGVIPPGESWYEYSAASDGKIRFTKEFYAIYKGKSYYCDLKGLSRSISTTNTGVYLRLLIDRIVDSNCDLYSFADIFNASSFDDDNKLVNYLKTDFEQFGGKEISNRYIDLLLGIYGNDGEPDNFNIPVSVPAIGGNVKVPGKGGSIAWLKIGSLTDGEFVPNYATVKIESEQGKKIAELLMKHTHTLSSLGAAAASHSHTLSSLGAAAANHSHDDLYYKKSDEQDFSNFIAIKTVISENPSGQEIVTATDKDGRVKITTFVSDTKITEVIKASATSTTVLKTKTIIFSADGNTITTSFS